MGNVKKLSAFTLIEMVIVIGIISVLMAMLYGGLERAQKFSRRTITYTEVKSIENAFKQYHAHYHCWPTNTPGETAVEISDGDSYFVIDRQLANVLRGNITDSSTEEIRNINYDAIPFIEFSRFYAKTPYPPVNPFPPTSDEKISDRQFHVKFDTNGDHQINIPADEFVTTATNVVGDVVVWTYVPGTRKGKTDESDSTGGVPPDERIESWSNFTIKNRQE